MAKSKKISSQDFLDLLDDEADQQTAAFRPLYFQKPETDNKEITNGYQTDNIKALEQITIEQQTDNKRITKISSKIETDNKQVTKRVTEQITEPPCSSSSNLNINNTTTTEPDLWLSVPKNLDGRVSIRQLRGFVKQNLISAEDLQSSLDGFAYDLEKGSIRAKNGNPVAILIGAVKSGGYISQSYLSELKASLADVAKAREEMEQIQAANSTQQLQEEFESFRAKFPDQAEQIKPMSKYLTNFELGSVGYKMWLEEYRKSQSIQPSLEAAEAKP